MHYKTYIFMVIMMHFMKQKIGYLIMICQSIIIFSSTNEYNAFHEML